MQLETSDHYRATMPVHPSADGDAGSDAVLNRVLLVDDSRLQRRILASSLRKWGLEVLEAGSGEEALAICRETPPDLIFSDWMMPGMSGLEFCHEVRKLPLDNYLYFILLTSKTDKGEIAAGLDNGADDFICKPVNSEELRARITAAGRLLKIERQLTEKNRLVTQTLDEMKRLNDALDRDLVEARKLQASLVPQRTARFDAAELSFLFQPSGHVGGDLAGYFAVGPDRIGLYSLDVSGHGIASALITARLAGWLSGTTPDRNRALRWQGDRIVMAPPEETCARLNAKFLSELDTEHYFTLVLADLDLRTGHMTLCQAGHPHPLVQRANGRLDFVGPGGLPVGLIPDAEFTSFELQLDPGDRVFLHSDGLTEFPTPDGGMIEEKGLADLFVRHRARSGDDLLSAILADVGATIPGQDFPDDVSGTLLEYRGGA